MKLNFAYTKCETTVVDAQWPGECRANDALNGQITDAPVLCRPQERGRRSAGQLAKKRERVGARKRNGRGVTGRESEKGRAT